MERLEYKKYLEDNYDLKIYTDNVEQKCLEQTEELLKLDTFKNSKVRLMPDTHAGKGAVIGFTAKLTDKIIPNIVGVDIGCGMLCVYLNNIEIDLENLDKEIYKKIPAGMNSFEKEITNFDKIKEIYCYDKLKNSNKFPKQIGTLGSGNHFIEIDIDDNNNKYLVIHTGSRNLGLQVAQYYQNLAIAKNKNDDISKELCHLEGKDREDYLHDMRICQEYAELNRETIAKTIVNDILKLDYDKLEKFHTVHNYISFVDYIIRKGAISAHKGEKVLIPLNMRDGALICIGKGNEEYNNSAPHGSGRVMSRKQAKENVNLDDYIESMKDIYTTSVNEYTLDESPFVYKNKNEIIENIKDTVDIVMNIKPIYNFKASK